MTNNKHELEAIKVFSEYLRTNKEKNVVGMNIATVQGFFYALLTFPCAIQPCDWFYIIFGGFPEFKSVEQQEKIMAIAMLLRKSVKDNLELGHKYNLSFWQEEKLVQLNDASDLVLSDFCSGYVKGYLLDPVLHEVSEEMPDLSFAFFLSIVKQCDENAATGQSSDINEIMRQTLQGIIIDNYNLWFEARGLNLPVTYFPNTFYQ